MYHSSSGQTMLKLQVEWLLAQVLQQRVGKGMGQEMPGTPLILHGLSVLFVKTSLLIKSLMLLLMGKTNISFQTTDVPRSNVG